MQTACWFDASGRTGQTLPGCRGRRACAGRAHGCRMSGGRRVDIISHPSLVAISRPAGVGFGPIAVDRPPRVAGTQGTRRRSDKRCCQVLRWRRLRRYGTAHQEKRRCAGHCIFEHGLVSRVTGRRRAPSVMMATAPFGPIGSAPGLSGGALVRQDVHARTFTQAMRNDRRLPRMASSAPATDAASAAWWSLSKIPPGAALSSSSPGSSWW